MTLEEKQTILQFWSPDQPFEFKGYEWHSNIAKVITDCRVVNGRDIYSGHPDNSKRRLSSINLPIICGYWGVLEHIGLCYRINNQRNSISRGNALNMAILNFSFDVIENSKEILQTLISFRNTFCKDFNLLNSPSNTSIQRHKFSLEASNSSWIVKNALESWSGQITTNDLINNKNNTIINILGIIHLAETTISRFLLFLKNDDVELQIPLISLVTQYSLNAKKIEI